MLIKGTVIAQQHISQTCTCLGTRIDRQCDGTGRANHMSLCLLKDRQDGMQTGTVTHAVVRSCAMRARIDSFFFSADLISCLHMRTICCCEKDGRNFEGMSAGFYTKTQTCGDIYASVRGSWTAVTFKSKSVPSLTL